MELTKLEKPKKKCLSEKWQKKVLVILASTALLMDEMLTFILVPLVSVYLEDFNNLPSQSNHVFDVSSLSNMTMDTIVENKITTEGSPSFINIDSTSYNILFKEYYTNQSTINSSTVSRQNVTQTSNGLFDIRIGLLFACKPIVQGILGPFVGTITDKVGFKAPMICGFLIVFFSSITFAFGSGYTVLVIARSVQGIGTSLTDSSGFASIAVRFKDSTERSKAQSIVLAVLNVGVYVAPPFGGFFHKYVGKSVPFVIIAVMAFVCFLLLVFCVSSKNETTNNENEVEEKQEGEEINVTPFYRLVLDPYIALCAGSILVTTLPWAFLEPTLTRWMTDALNVDEFQAGIVWLPSLVFHLAAIYLTVKLTEHYVEWSWLIIIINLVIEGGSCITIYYCTHFALVMLPLAVASFGFAVTETTVTPIMAKLIDLRHVSAYGSVYALLDLCYCIVFALGFVVSDILYQHIGFLWLNVIVCLITVLYSPLMIVLKTINLTKCNSAENLIE